MPKGYHHLTDRERCQIHALKKSGERQEAARPQPRDDRLDPQRRPARLPPTDWRPSAAARLRDGPGR